MKQRRTYLAADLGAGSGRVIAAHFDGQRLELEEIARFPNEAVELPDGLHWDIVGLYRNVLAGFGTALDRWPGAIMSAGIDTWGVDYALLGSDGGLLGLPFAYRDKRTDGMMERVRGLVDDAALYAETGIQRLFFNTLYQLAAARERHPTLLDSAHCLLFLPDLLNYWMTGRQAVERTIASTSQLYNPRSRGWATPLIERLGLPGRLFGELVDPGHPLGEARLGGHRLQLVTVASHDTASAVAAVPMRGPESAYLSSGTWSLIGIESDTPILGDEARAANFTNEVGVGHSIRFLRNITGLWLVQQCLASWGIRTGSPDFQRLLADAAQARPFTAFIDPDSPAFVTPGDMPARIAAQLVGSGQTAPGRRSEILRVILESLALKCAVVMEELRRISGREIRELHIVGGGCRDALLNQFTASATGIPVVAGPVEATASGNALVQMIAAGDIRDLSEGRELIHDSFETPLYEPGDSAAWSEALQRYKALLATRAS